jgi:hypothetical protein
MPSTYTPNNGIEIIATGEQSGTWGDTTNTNLELIDVALDGQLIKTLAVPGISSSPNALAITNGDQSDGRNRLIVFTDGGDLGSTAYVQLTPNDAEKIIYVRNDLAGGRSIIFFQGTYNASNDFELPAGKDAIVKFNGGGSGAITSAVFEDLYLANATVGTLVNTNLQVSNIAALDGTSAGSIADSTGVVTLASSVLTTADINGGTLDNVTIGGDTPAAATFTTATATNVQVTNIKANDGTSAMTIADSTGVVTIPSAVSTNVQVTNIKANDGTSAMTIADSTGIVTFAAGTTGTTQTLTTIEVTGINANDGTASATIADATGVMTVASSVLTTTDINGGTIDGVTIGGASAGAGTFTSVTGTSLDMNGSADFAGNINLSQASNTTIKRDDNTGFLSIQGGTDALSTSLVMYGNAHATLPNWTILEADTMVFRTVDNTDFMRFVDGTGAVFNEGGADLDFRIESDTNTHAFFLQGSDGDVGIGTGSPAEKLEVTGNIILDAADATIKIKSGTAGTAGAVNFTFNTDSTVYGSLSLPYDTRTSVGLLVKSNNAYPMSIASGTSSSATNAVILSTSGQEAMRVNYLGRVGIGTASPATTLDVNGTITGTGLDMNGDAVFNESGADVDFRIESDTNANAFFLQGSDGKIGIGTGSPLQSLHVNSNGNTQLLISSSFNNSTVTGLVVDTVGDSSVFRISATKSGVGRGTLSFLHSSTAALETWNLNAAGSTVYAAGYSEHIWKTGNNERMRITSTGNVGIGTSSPVEPLHVARLGGADNTLPAFSGITAIVTTPGGTATSSGSAITIHSNVSGQSTLNFSDTDDSDVGYISYSHSEDTLRFGVNNSERMRIDSDGDVGIGTSSPQARLDVTDTTGNQLVVGTNTNAAGTEAGILFKHHTTVSNYDGGGIRSVRNASSNDFGLALDVGRNAVSTIGMFISGADATPGYVGIGTSSPSAKLEVDAGSATGTQLQITTTGLGHNFDMVDGRSTARIRNTDGSLRLSADNSNEQAGSEIVFLVDGSEKIYIDSSGNLLVGKASADYTTAGVMAEGDGTVSSVKAGVTGVFNRLTTDGDIMQFRKDNTTVGSIGVANNDIYVGTNDTTLTFIDGADNINPTGTNGAQRSDAISLGDLNNRFKDLYLSGGVYLGGTVAANHLDDYEEGTWTPTYTGQSGQPDSISYDLQEATYTKIGSVVTVVGKIQTSGITGNFSGGIRLSGLPFDAIPATDIDGAGGMVVANCVNFLDDFPCSGYLRANLAHITLRTRTDFKSQLRDMLNADMLKVGSGNLLAFSATYITDE